MFGFFKRKPVDVGSHLKGPIEAWVREWMVGQLADLPDDERPSEDELEDDIVRMRDEVLSRQQPTLNPFDGLRAGVPDDAVNRAALQRLKAAFAGMEADTPIFTSLVLAKIGQPDFASGWPLCALRVVLETSLKDVRQHQRALRGS